MEDKINIRLVKQKINDINYDYDILYNEIENKMKNNDIIDLGVKKINFCGLFNITIDVIPDIIKKKTVITLITKILKYLQYVEISYNNFRLRLNIYPIINNQVNPITKFRTENDDIKKIFKNIYKKIDIYNEKLDDNLFIYFSLLLLSILESSSFILLNHQLNIECIPLEDGLELYESEDFIIKKIFEFLKN